MDVLILMKVRTSAPTGQIIADAAHKAVQDVLDAANLKAVDNTAKINTILAFELNEIRPNSSVTKFITFPDVLVDLEKDLNTNKTTP
jgi:hypothetical protein